MKIVTFNIFVVLALFQLASCKLHHKKDIKLEWSYDQYKNIQQKFAKNTRLQKKIDFGSIVGAGVKGLMTGGPAGALAAAGTTAATEAVEDVTGGGDAKGADAKGAAGGAAAGAAAPVTTTEDPKESIFYECFEVIKEDKKDDKLWDQCFCLINPDNIKCLQCGVQFENPKCCEDVLKDPKASDVKFQFCCEKYKHHAQCKCNNILDNKNEFPESQQELCCMQHNSVFSKPKYRKQCCNDFPELDKCNVDLTGVPGALNKEHRSDRDY